MLPSRPTHLFITFKQEPDLLMWHYHVYAGNEKTFNPPQGQELVKKMRILTGNQSAMNAYAKRQHDESDMWLRYEIMWDKHAGYTALNDVYYPKPDQPRGYTWSNTKRLGFMVESAVLDDLKTRIVEKGKAVSNIMTPYDPLAWPVSEPRRTQLAKVNLSVNKVYPIDEWHEKIKRGIRLLH